MFCNCAFKRCRSLNTSRHLRVVLQKPLTLNSMSSQLRFFFFLSCLRKSLTGVAPCRCASSIHFSSRSATHHHARRRHRAQHTTRHAAVIGRNTPPDTPSPSPGMPPSSGATHHQAHRRHRAQHHHGRQRHRAQHTIRPAAVIGRNTPPGMPTRQPDSIST